MSGRLVRLASLTDNPTMREAARCDPDGFIAPARRDLTETA